MLTLTNSSLLAQSISFISNDLSEFPLVKSKFYLYDTNSNNYFPTQNEINIKENNLLRNVISIKNNQKNFDSSISSTLYYDIKSNLPDLENNQLHIDFVKQLSSFWIDIQNPTSETALAYNDNKYTFLQDFSSNKNELYNALDLLKSNYTINDLTFIDRNIGALEIAKKGKFQKAIIFFIDSDYNTIAFPEKIIQELNQNNIKLYVLCINSECQEQYKKIVESVNGRYYENIRNLDDAKNILREVRSRIQGIDESIITWEALDDCNSEQSKLRFEWNAKYSESLLNYPDSLKSKFQLSTSKIILKGDEFANYRDTSIVLKAIFKDIEIKNIKLLFGSNKFEILHDSLPFVIAKNTQKNLKIRYSANDNKNNNAVFEFETDKCKEYLSILNDFYNESSTNNQLKLTFPNNKEMLIASLDTMITWEGVSPKDTVCLDYSIDSGKTWNLINAKATNLKYYWQNIPNLKGKNCLIRVQLFKEADQYNKSFTLDRQLNFINQENYLYVWSPNSTKFASGTNDSNIYIKEAQTGKKLLTLKSKLPYVKAIKWSSNGKFIATLCTGQNLISIITIWNPENGDKVREIEYSNYLENIEISPDNKKIAAFNSQYPIVLLVYDIEEDSMLTHEEKSGSNISKISWNSNSDQIAFLTYPNYIKIIDIQKMNIIKELQIAKNNYPTFLWNYDDSKFIYYEENSLKILDTKNWQLSQQIDEHSSKIIQIQFSQNKSILISTSLDSVNFVWDAKTWKKIIKMNDNIPKLFKVEFNCNKTKIVTFSDNYLLSVFNLTDFSKLSEVRLDGLNYFYGIADSACKFIHSFQYLDSKYLVNVINVQSGKIQSYISGHFSISSFYSFKNSNKILTYGEENKIILWDPINEINLLTISDFSTYISKNYLPFVVNNNEKKMATISKDEKYMSIWDLEQNKLISKIKLFSILNSYPEFSPDANYIALKGYYQDLNAKPDSNLRIWNCNTGELVKTIKQDFGLGYSLIWSKDSKYLYQTNYYDSNLYITDISNGSLYKKIASGLKAIYYTSLNPDSTKIAITGSDNNVEIWDLKKYTLLQKINDQNNNIFGIEWNNDGKQLIIKSNQSISFWDVESGKILNQIKSEKAIFSKAKFSSNSNQLITLENNICKIWDLNSNQAIDTITKTYFFETSNDFYNLITLDLLSKINFYRIKINPLQSDLSDEFISTFKSTFVIKDIELTNLKNYINNDTIIHGFLTNTSDYDCRIDSIYSAYSLNPMFSKFHNNLPFILKANQSIDLGLKFYEGSYINHIYLHTKSQNDVVQSLFKMRFNGYYDNITAINSLVDFKNNLYRKNKRINDIALFKKNKNDSLLKIKSIKLVGLAKDKFTFDFDSSKMDVSNNEIFYVNIKYLSNKIGRHNCQLEIEFENSNYIFTANLFAETIVDSVNSINGNSEKVQEPVVSMQVFPNPINSQSILELNSLIQGGLELNLINQSGQNVLDIYNGEITKGTRQFKIDSDNLASGEYYILLKCSTFTDFLKIKIIK